MHAHELRQNHCVAMCAESPLRVQIQNIHVDGHTAINQTESCRCSFTCVSRKPESKEQHRLVCCLITISRRLLRQVLLATLPYLLCNKVPLKGCVND